MAEKEALFFKKLTGNRVQCDLCPHHCQLKDGQSGLCRVRENRRGILYTRNYGEVVSLALDPMEKKPLYHFYPGSMILSAGTYGCNFSCEFCQNYQLAHGNPPTRFLDPGMMVELALQSKAQGSVGLAFTYNEPTIWYEYIRDAAPGLKEQGLKIVLVTNGFIELAPLQELLPFVDAVNIDVKAFNESFYRKICKGKLEPVLKTVEYALSRTHVEVTTLVVPGENDNIDEMRDLACWLSGLSPNLPLHLSRYHPAYKYDLPATSGETMLKAYHVMREHLNFVYLGNMGCENVTVCQSCGKPLITRSYYYTDISGLNNGSCAHCGSSADFIVC